MENNDGDDVVICTGCGKECRTRFLRLMWYYEPSLHSRDREWLAN